MSPPSESVPLVVVISGPSGAGKDTVINQAMDLDASLAKVATAKTRPPRAGEVDGIHHVFLSNEEFERWVAADAFLEYVESYGHRSGVPRSAVAELLAQGRTVILRTDVEGAETLKQQLNQPLLVFVTVPDINALEQRIRARGAESEPEIAVRLAEAEAEMAESAWFDEVILNRDGRQGEAARRLVDVIEAERQRRQ